MRRRTGRGIGAEGFSLVELLVSMVLLTLALALAAQLLVEAQQTFALAGRAARDPDASYALAQLRADVHGAFLIAESADGALLFSSPMPDVRRWEREGDLLVRTVFRDGKAVRRRMLGRVSAWQWSWDGSLLHVEILYRRGPALRYVAPARLAQDPDRPEAVTLRLHPRALTRWNRW